MSKKCKVHFVPDDITVEVPVGSTLLAAANAAGVYVNSLCGGDGVCGRCRVILRSGKTTGESTEYFTHDEIRAGYILACEARAESDVEVEIPPETRQTQTAPEHEKLKSEVPQLKDLSRGAQRQIKLAPLMQKHYVELPKPTLENNVSDLQRLEQELHKVVPAEGFQMGLKVTRRLPKILRDADWKLTAITGHRGPLTEIVSVESGDTRRRNMCIAVDIGTTTVVCHLVDLRDGQTLGQEAKYNSQANYGADVIRRIIHASTPDGEKALREAIVGDINELIHGLTRRYHLTQNDISFISAAGNTTMLHLLLGLPSENIRKEPYVGVAYRLPAFRAAEMGLHINPRGLLYCLPCVAGFVGADTVSGIYASGMCTSDDVRMLIDIGTNGEIVVGNKEFLVCASASAGPAFEGAECKCGMRATAGAIDHIRLHDADHVMSYSTIGSSPPLGFSGTGYVNMIAEMLRAGVIDKTGRMNPDASKTQLRESEFGELEYLVIPAAQTGNGKDITVSQGDVKNILRAKAAIYAAATVLLRSLDMSFSDLTEILVAGAFGNFLNVDNAVCIGLLPDISPERLRFVGNSSLAGAKLAALCCDCYDEIFNIADRTTYFELSTQPDFMDEFVSASFFPHTNTELFPSVNLFPKMPKIPKTQSSRKE
ncbi:MAG: DUF4445 domain-containing protein [Phycisphaerae bacterium]|nr:DUF4445 domain-containing protein [Phycisphaerae bacterium]